MVEIEVGSPAAVWPSVNGEDGRNGLVRSVRLQEPALDLCSVDAREAQRHDGRRGELLEHVGVEAGEAALLSRAEVDEVEVSGLEEPERSKEDALASGRDRDADPVAARDDRM